MDDRIKTIADHYGYEAQSRQLIEEMAELTQALSKEWRCAIGCLTDENYDVLVSIIAEEAADVEIMLEQLKYLLEIENEAAYWKERKLERTMGKIEPEKMVAIIGGVHGIHYDKEYKTYYWRVDTVISEDAKFRPGDLAVVHTKYGIERVLVTEVMEVPESEAAQYDKAIAKVVFENGKQQG